jgi:hypothetical protein
MSDEIRIFSFTSLFLKSSFWTFSTGNTGIYGTSPYIIICNNIHFIMVFFYDLLPSNGLIHSISGSFIQVYASF